MLMLLSLAMLSRQALLPSPQASLLPLKLSSAPRMVQRGRQAHAIPTERTTVPYMLGWSHL